MGTGTEISEETNKEIEELQEVVTVLRQQLRERDKQIDHLKQTIGMCNNLFIENLCLLTKARGQPFSEGLEETQIQEIEPIQSISEKAGTIIQA